MNTQFVHLLRHGEVENPDHVVYASLDGFGLSALGRTQAAQAAAALEDSPIAAIVSSPLQRALETAAPHSQMHGIPVAVDDGLTEWGLSSLWAGVVWDELPTVRPGELEAYLGHPHDLPFSPESLEQLAARVAGAVRRNVPPSGDLVVISHQDPVQAGRRALIGVGLGDFHADKPAHASVITLEVTHGDNWLERRHWKPDQGDAFPPT